MYQSMVVSGNILEWIAQPALIDACRFRILSLQYGAGT